MKNSKRIAAACLTLALIVVAAVATRGRDFQGEENGILFQTVATGDTRVLNWLEEEDIPTGADAMQVMCYFADEEMNLLSETRTVEKTPGVARKTVEELLKGPKDPTLSTTIPEGTVLLDINITSGGKCIVDLSKEFVQFESESAAKTGIFSIVNALTEFQSVKEVEFRVDGKTVNSICGVDLSKPLHRNENLLA